MANDLLSSAKEATTASLATAETACSSRPATQHVEDAGAQYADHQMDQLLEDIDFRISCLLELSPAIQRCMEHDDAQSKVSPIVVSFETPQEDPQTQNTFKILEEKYSKASRELLKRLCMAGTRDMSQARADSGLCTFDDCWARYRVFEGAQWAHHEFSQHRFNRAWTCYVCQQIEEDESAWQEHLSGHSIDLKAAQIPRASQIACHGHPRPVEQERCHFCGEYPASTREGFERHVGAHFQDAFELIAAYSAELTEPRSSEDTARPHSSTEKIDSSLDIHPQSICPSPDFLDQGPFASDPESPDREHIEDSILLPSAMAPSPPSNNEVTDSALNTGSPPIFRASFVTSLPPPKAVKWRCGSCQVAPMMTLNNETHCSNCGRRYDAYSTYYDRRSREIEF